MRQRRVGRKRNDLTTNRPTEQEFIGDTGRHPARRQKCHLWRDPQHTQIILILRSTLVEYILVRISNVIFLRVGCAHGPDSLAHTSSVASVHLVHTQSERCKSLNWLSSIRFSRDEMDPGKKKTGMLHPLTGLTKKPAALLYLPFE